MRIRGFTLIELLIVISIIVVLTAMTIPAVTMVRDASRRTACASNLRNLVVATLAYTSDENNMLPEGGSFNAAARGDWFHAPGVCAIMSYVDTIASNSLSTTKLVRCPANADGLMYPFWPGVPTDHHTSLDRIIDSAHKAMVPNGVVAIWSDACYTYDAGDGRNFKTACGHRGKYASDTSGLPKGGNVACSDGSVCWAPYVSTNPTTDIAMVINQSCIGINQAVPSNMTWMRMTTTGTLDVSRWDNFIIGRNGFNYATNF